MQTAITSQCRGVLLSRLHQSCTQSPSRAHCALSSPPTHTLRALHSPLLCIGVTVPTPLPTLLPTPLPTPGKQTLLLLPVLINVQRWCSPFTIVLPFVYRSALDVGVAIRGTSSLYPCCYAHTIECTYRQEGIQRSKGQALLSLYQQGSCIHLMYCMWALKDVIDMLHVASHA